MLRSVLPRAAGNSRLLFKQWNRHLSLHEHQSQDLLRKYNVPIPNGIVAADPTEVKAAVGALGGRCWANPQVPGNQWHSQAPQFIDSYRDHDDVSGQLFSETPNLMQVYVTQDFEHVDEWRLAIRIDRENCAPKICVSSAQTDGKELEIPFTVSQGITSEVVSQISQYTEASAEGSRSLRAILQGLYRIFTEKDGIALEVNSLLRLRDGSFTCMRSNFTFDDAAAKRQQDLFALRDTDFEVAQELEAEKYGLVYVKMDGDIGNVVNGAGLAMATNDAISYYGGNSANFLDGGGQATKETMIKAFEIVLTNEKVKSIIVNVYGGITNGVMIAEAVIGAVQELAIEVPMVVRIQGTNSAAGLKLLEEADLGIYVESDFGAAAKKAVELAQSA